MAFSILNKVSTSTSSTATPGVVIAATSSGSGKTTIATGLLRALSTRATVAPFKVGPDYIDPGYHGLATGTVGRNLDAVMCQGLIGSLYAHGSAGADIGVVEGVMGLFDGRITASAGQSSEAEVGLAVGSTAAVAAELGMPVILVVDVRGMSQSVGALVRGFLTQDTAVHIAGVILNKVGTPRHAAVCTAAVEALGVPVLGAIPRVDHIAVPSRHLGLVTAGELGEAEAAVARMGDIVEEHVDVEAILRLAYCRWRGQPWDPQEAIAQARARESEAAPDTQPAPQTAGGPGALLHPSPVIAMTAGPAFSFTYAEHTELLAAAGATVFTFDPLVDDLPECDGLIIPGGFPEEHVEALSGRKDLTAHIRTRIADGMPVHAECAGLLWLLGSLDDHAMLGVIETTGAMSQRLTLGYREAVSLHDSVLYRAGQRVVGHEFHHTALASQTAPDFTPAWGWKGWDGTPKAEGFIGPGGAGNIHASYLHVHPAAVPEAIVRFVDACAKQ